MSIPPHRRNVVDLLRYQRDIPTVAHDRVMSFGEVDALRRTLAVKISWPTIIIRAFALVAAGIPQLRQTYMRGPFSRIYEHPHSIAMLAVARQHRGDPWLFFGRLGRPEEASLVDLQQRIERFASEPVDRVFRNQLRTAAIPWPLRRLFWRLRLHVSGSRRVRRLGTFGLTTLAGKGISITDIKAPISHSLTYGPFDERRRTEVRLIYDHRIIDGSTIADALLELERMVQETILQEMKGLGTVSGPAIEISR